MHDEKMFEVGDRVRYMSDSTIKMELIGEVGTVVYDGGDGSVLAVEFDNDIRGHSCSGRTKQFHGWLCCPSELDAIVKDPSEVQINFSFDDFLKGVLDEAR